VTGPLLITVDLRADFRFAHCAPISFWPTRDSPSRLLPSAVSFTVTTGRLGNQQVDEVLSDATCYGPDCPINVAGDLNMDASKAAVALQLAKAKFQDAVASPRASVTPAPGLLERGARIDWAFIRGRIRGFWPSVQ